MDAEHVRAKAYVDSLWRRRASERRLDAMLAGNAAAARDLLLDWKPLTQHRTMPPLPQTLYGTTDDEFRADRAN